MERARETLAEGGGLDAALAVIEESHPADTAPIPWIRAVREVTGFSLVDTMRLREDLLNGVPLGHLGAREVAVLADLHDDPTRHARDWFRDALVHREPAVTFFRGAGRYEGGVVVRRGDRTDPPPGHRDGWAAGDFAAIRAQLHALAASGHPLGERVTVEDRGADAVVVRFDLA